MNKAGVRMINFNEQFQIDKNNKLAYTLIISNDKFIL